MAEDNEKDKKNRAVAQTQQQEMDEKGEAASKKQKPVMKKAKKVKGNRKWWIKDVILAALNFLFLAGLMILLGILPDRGAEYGQQKNRFDLASAKSEVEIAEFEIEDSSQKADEIKAIFPDESGLAGFAGEMDILRVEGLINSFSFASERAVRDKTGYYGVPIIIRLSGSWDKISQGLVRIEELPYLIRAVSIEAVVSVQDNLVDYTYGGFLYVDESLAETR